MAEITYPSLEGPDFTFLDQPCVAFEKYDGFNLRFFWDERRGWHSTGTRYRWFKAVTPLFGPAVEMFQRAYAKGINDTVRRLKEYRGVKELVAFCEFFGPGTFSGLHKEDEPKQVRLFDLYLPGRGFVPPKDFVAHLGTCRSPRWCTKGASPGRSSMTCGAADTPWWRGWSPRGCIPGVSGRARRTRRSGWPR